jgi:two-component system sensor histidine kinase/response regulator
VIHLAVQDTGIGIAKDKIDAVFEAFRQSDSSTTRRYGGTGLGLSISMQLVQLMEGRIWLESEVGEGSTFRCEIPLALGAEQQLSLPAASAASAVNAMIVSDNDHARAIYAEMLGQCGIHAIESASGNALTQELSEVAVIDLAAAGQAQWRVAEQLAKEPADRRPAIIMLIPAGQVDAAERCRALGISRVLIKPAKLSELQSAVKSVIGSDEDVSKTSTGPASWTAQRPLRILVADDSPVNQEVARGLLELCGHEVSLADDGLQAVEQFENGEFDLVLMDIEMPELDGLAAARRLREIESSRGAARTPIVALSAHALVGFSADCEAAGMDGYLAKPIRPDELFALTQAVADQPAAQDVLMKS